MIPLMSKPPQADPKHPKGRCYCGSPVCLADVGCDLGLPGHLVKGLQRGGLRLQCYRFRTTEFELSQLGQARRGLSVQLTKGGESRKA